MGGYGGVEVTHCWPGRDGGGLAEPWAQPGAPAAGAGAGAVFFVALVSVMVMIMVVGLVVLLAFEFLHVVGL